MACNPYEPPKCDLSKDEQDSRGVNRHQRDRSRLTAVWIALAQQAPLVLLASLILDGGRMLRIAVLATVAAWIANALILLRRRDCLSRVDALVVKYGVWAFLPLVPLLASLLHRAW